MGAGLILGVAFYATYFAKTPDEKRVQIPEQHISEAKQRWDRTNPEDRLDKSIHDVLVAEAAELQLQVKNMYNETAIAQEKMQHKLKDDEFRLENLLNVTETSRVMTELNITKAEAEVSQSAVDDFMSKLDLRFMLCRTYEEFETLLLEEKLEFTIDQATTLERNTVAARDLL